MLARVVVYLGAVTVGLMLILERPVPLAVAPPALPIELAIAAD